MSSGGIPTEQSYPYTSGHTVQQGQCLGANGPVQAISGYQSLHQDENAIMHALVNTGPVAVAMDASDLSGYSSGVYDCPPNWSLDHAVVIVGYAHEK